MVAMITLVKSGILNSETLKRSIRYAVRNGFGISFLFSFFLVLKNWIIVKLNYKVWFQRSIDPIYIVDNQTEHHGGKSSFNLRYLVMRKDENNNLVTSVFLFEKEKTYTKLKLPYLDKGTHLRFWRVTLTRGADCNSLIVHHHYRFVWYSIMK